MGVKVLVRFVLLFLVLGIAGIYFFISSSIRVSKQIAIKGSEKNMYSLMSKPDNWRLWLNKPADASDFSFNATNKIYPAIIIEAKTSDRIVPIEIDIQGTGKADSIILSWHCEIPAGIMPWTRLHRYLEARQLKQDFSEIIKRFIEYTSVTKNVYGIDIVETKLKDTIIATLSRYELRPPSDSLGCLLISELRQEVSRAGLSITDSPMTIIIPVQEGKYKMMVGFPVNKVAKPNSSLVIKKMIPGKLLTATVYGGPGAISNGYEQLRKYIIDHNKEEVALPYEVAVINRCVEKDTSKWITALCYPVY